MNFKSAGPILAAISIAMTAPAAIAGSGDDGMELREASRELSKRFAAQLKDELTRAMVGGGPPDAVKVCAERAPLIAAELSRESGAKIGRTSLRFRNPANAPEAWQHQVLTDFDERGSSAETAALEYFSARPAPGVKARYMMAIVTKPMCLACHGEPQQPVKLYLDELYPHDRATGYEAGDIRGAFYVSWPDED